MFRSFVSRRTIVLISLGLLMLAAMTIVLAPKGALADGGMPLKGNFTVAFSGMPNTAGVSFCGGTPSGVVVEAHGVGHSSLGDLSFSLQKTTVGPAFHGCLTLTSLNGDTLTAIYDLTAGAPNANLFRDATGTLTFTGGTGRFEGASGSADVTAVFSRIGGTAAPTQGIAFYSVDGTVSLQQSDQ
ncbi:MAG TPA: hypothetical protein VNB49_18165 [Candidatus Dormibacteraeota bacterium]|nr:hypothetical protein [Candidatus Dormibacteraeota bacterium]